MLERFRASYPTGCLISELITIHNGKYIVRALVLVNGETLATGLGSADTVELAEDKARERSLSCLTLDTSFSAPQTSVELSPSPSPSATNHKSQFTKSVNTPLQIKTEELPTAGLNLDFNEVSDTPTVLSALLESEIPTSLEKEELLTVESSINYDDISDSAQDSSGFDNSWLDTDYSQEQKEEKFDETTESLTDSTNQLETKITTSEPINSEIDLAPKINSNNETYASDLSQDVSDDNVSIDILMDSLAWTKEQEREFIEQNYSQKTRQFLTTEELSHFHQYLDILHKVTKTIKGQGWNAKQQKDYLDYNHNKESLDQLSIDELQSFLQYLEVFTKTTDEIKRLGWNTTKGKTFLKKNYGEEGRTRLSFEQLQDFLQKLEALDTHQ
ncbi:MAG: hypothetical protein F6K40_30060 [Okeania sp. SIO3I5]|uniref:hypothetical protein n=1 Tax=Okeania sp. SIO3I5 TaxID=2607805 RepID=UPI0013B9B669|nr:hypothetical protein [Okeania sp. SIO3I5]NEQ40260.1 hypothetical protein [Okeania sp. SIO3I5]